jgi:amino acid transporter
MTWSFARDNGTPFSAFLSQVSPKRRVPVAALGVACGLACVLNLIYIGSSTAFNDVVSLTITGFYSTYLVPAAMLLYHRVRGDILPHGSDADPVVSNEGEKEKGEKEDGDQVIPSLPNQPNRRKSLVAQAQLVWGPFRLPGVLGTINNAYACVYMVFVIFWSVWPPETPVDYTTMNYSVVVTGAVVIFSIVWYFVSARKTYHGPLIDDEVATVMRAGSVVHV